MTKTLTIVDADSIYFRIACVTTVQKEIRQSIDRTMKEIHGATFLGDLMVAVKGRGNFRKDIYDKYKANRKDLEPEMKKALNYGHTYMKEKWNAIEADGMEADDLVSIWASEAREAEIPYVIAGIDKDLLQIPGSHYNFVKKTHQFIDDDRADYLLHIQCLTGDNSDNIPGIKGIGPKKAEKILAKSKAGRHWGRVRAAWRAHNAGDPTLSKRLLTMLTSWDELDEINKQIESKTSIG